jgi:hypothetical protein
LIEVDRGDIQRINLEVKFLDSSLTAKIDVKGHQSPGQTFLTMLGMDTEIEEFGFFLDISKTDKSDGAPFLTAVSPEQEETMGERVGHLPQKHIL